MTGEHNISGLLAAVTMDEPPPESGPAAVFNRARSIQRRRSLGVALAGTGTLAVLTLAGVSLAGAFGPAAAVTPAPAAPAATPTTGADRVPVAGEAVLGTLRKLLPAGSQTGDELTEQGFARLVVTDSAGRTTVEVNVQPDFIAGAGKATDVELLARYDCAKRTDPAGTQCTDTTLADKTRVVSIDGAADEPGTAGVTRRQVDALAPDGLRIVVTVWNAVDLRNGPATRPAPALDDHLLREIATSGRWREAPTGATSARIGPGGGRNG